MAFNREFPNTVARNLQLSAAGLVYIAYRSTFVGDYVLDPETIAKRKPVRKGLGKNAAKAALAEAKGIGYLKRWQPPGAPGSFSRVREQVCLPKAAGKQVRYVSQAWFDGTIDVKEMAALLFLRAGTGKSQDTYRRELEERFGWSPPTAARVINGLMERGLLGKVIKRRPDGTHISITYSVPQLAADRLAPSVRVNATVKKSDDGKTATIKKPGNGKPGNGKPGDAKPGDYLLFELTLTHLLRRNTFTHCLRQETITHWIKIQNSTLLALRARRRRPFRICTKELLLMELYSGGSRSMALMCPRLYSRMSRLPRVSAPSTP
jgi:hypothetical protein